MSPTIISETPIDIGDIKAELERIKARDSELNVRMGRVEEYVNAFMPLEPSKARELYTKIDKLQVPRLKDVHIHKIIDILPSNMNILKAVIRSYPITISNDNMKRILDTVLEYIDAKKA